MRLSGVLIIGWRLKRHMLMRYLHLVDNICLFLTPTVIWFNTFKDSAAVKVLYKRDVTWGL